MEYIYSALLLHSAGKEITEEAVEKVLKAAGLKPDPARVKALVASLADVNIEEAIKSAAFAPQAAQPAGAAPAAAPAEKKEEEKKEEEEAPSEEEALSGLGALFG
ncbi:MAG: 50S ribosomal protein P1 [Thermoplasmata archaeon]|nr:50S ribosomal protein P1 [Thermoplasmata archaeon]OYT47996.1 MAG: 50S ribosomal protein P1 [Thermoplasmatales archaeon ex4484_36]HDD60146.1 50S ribosomal protein P1 [Euryarchaeota archaeon]RLF56304.1 MAG: 50S ribosomal protein P1 [Thermoplasmata archaeon]RLF71042.1 MAG: 50S ribosomal protein P1 [Thermoplasmata archaeon]